MPDSVWLHYDQKALDDQYNQRILVPDANEYMARHGVLSEQVRATLECQLDIPYGPSDDEKVDIFPAAQKGAPLVIYFHGGAWTRWHKDNNSFQAPHFVDAGATFIPVNFALVPQVSLEELVRQCKASVAWAYEHAADFGADPNKLYVAGHSSGAHVVGLIAVTDWATEYGLPADVIKGAYAASGMHDLEPVRLCSRQEYLNLDAEAENRLSAMRHIPERMPPMIIAYGGGEQKEFRRQSKDWAKELRRLGHPVVAELDLPGLHHFEVAEQFANPDGPLLQAIFQDMGLQ